MATIKEMDLPNADTLSASDYIRIVDSAGASKKIAAPQVTPVGMADYVIEQGASGGWQYRKWNSGKAECWIKSRQTRTSSTSNFKISLPFTLVESSICIQASGGATGYTDAYVMYVECGATQTDIYVKTPSGTYAWAYVYVFGQLA